MKYSCTYVLLVMVQLCIWYLYFFSRFFNIEEINAPEVMPVIVNYKYHVKN